MPRLRIATRGSELALAQADYVEERLRQLGYETEKIIIKTTGDVNLAPFALAAGDERKGLFTKEIEDALLANDADIAVHSYKDLPSVSVPELVIAAVPQRLDARDYALFLKTKRVQLSFPFVAENSVVGTSSVRRRSQLKTLFPGLGVQELRGNVPTRVKKLFEKGGPDAILLSGGGVERLIATGRFVADELREQLEIVPVDVSTLVPAPAQGTLAVQCRAQDSVALEALGRLHDARLATGLGIERGILAALEGGCHLPLGAHATLGGQTPDDDVSYFEAHVYLGEEYVKTRYRRSIQVLRRHAVAEKLKAFLVDELKAPNGGFPVYVFGRKERVQELRRAHGVNGFGVLDPRPVEGQDRDALAAAARDADVLVLFSAEGVRSFAGQYGEVFASAAERDGLIWAVPGKHTAELLIELGVSGSRVMIGYDGTGGGVARALLDRSSAAVVALSAEEGREEFHAILAAAGREARRFAIYRTVGVELERDELLSMPDAAYLIFGSPNAFAVFSSSIARHGRPWSEDWRICSIGQTTSAAIREEGRRCGASCLVEPYMTALQPDYDAMIREILGT